MPLKDLSLKFYQPKRNSVRRFRTISPIATILRRTALTLCNISDRRCPDMSARVSSVLNSNHPNTPKLAKIT